MAMGALGIVYGDRVLRKVNRITTTGGHFIENAGQHAEDGAGLLGQSLVEASARISTAVSSFGNNLDTFAISMGNSIELSSRWFAFGNIVKGLLQCAGHWRIAEAIDRVNVNVAAFRDLVYNLPIQCFQISDANRIQNPEYTQQHSDAQTNVNAPSLSFRLHSLKESALNTSYTGIMVMVIESFNDANCMNKYLECSPQRRNRLELKKVISRKHLELGILKELQYERFCLYFATDKEELVIEEIDLTETSASTKALQVKTDDKVVIRNLRTRKSVFFEAPSVVKPYLPPSAGSNPNRPQANVEVEVGAAKYENNDLTIYAYLGESVPVCAQLITYWRTGNGLVYGVSALCQSTVSVGFYSTTGAFLAVPCLLFHGYRKYTTGKYF